MVVRIGQCPRQEGYEQEQYLEREAPVEDESFHCCAQATTVAIFGELTESTAVNTHKQDKPQTSVESGSKHYYC